MEMEMEMEMKYNIKDGEGDEVRPRCKILSYVQHEGITIFRISRL